MSASPAPLPPQQPLLTVEAVAAELAVEPKVVMSLIKRGQLAAVRVTHTIYRVQPSDLVAFKQSRLTAGELAEKRRAWLRSFAGEGLRRRRRASGRSGCGNSASSAGGSHAP